MAVGRHSNRLLFLLQLILVLLLLLLPLATPTDATLPAPRVVVSDSQWGALISKFLNRIGVPRNMNPFIKAAGKGLVGQHGFNICDRKVFSTVYRNKLYPYVMNCGKQIQEAKSKCQERKSVLRVCYVDVGEYARHCLGLCI